MTYTQSSILDVLKGIQRFRQLPETELVRLSAVAQPLRYRMGQPILRRETLPHQIAILLEGQARLLGYDPRTQEPVTLKRLGKGELIGIAGLVRGIPCETVLASTEVTCLTLPAQAFLRSLEDYPEFGRQLRYQCHLAEAFDLLSKVLADAAHDPGDLRQLITQAASGAIVCYLPSGQARLHNLNRNRNWMISSGVVNQQTSGEWLATDATAAVQVVGGQARLVGFQPTDYLPTEDPTAIAEGEAVDRLPLDPDTIPYAEADTEVIAEDTPEPLTPYPYVRGRGEVGNPLACFQMLSQQFNLPFRRDVIRRIVANQVTRAGKLSLPPCGAIAEMMGLKTQLAKVPVDKLSRLPTPALISWQEGIAILYEATARRLVLAVPEVGIIRRTPLEFQETWGEEGELLLLERTAETPSKRFGLQWFLPSLKRYRSVLIEVFIASFFVQLFGLANPLMVQVIIDRVIVQNSIDTLQVLGILLVVVAVFEALLTSLRTYLFVDTTNRIDMALGSEIIDHLLRLPLRYFDRRPVGELASRVNELENIRQFLTGTALTVVLDAVFSLLYIIVMLIYSWVLTLVALASIPLFIGLTLIVSPIVRRQLRTKAERNASTQSYLVEALSGIQTVKAQNIELKTRWQWQDHYARYVSAGFNTVLTSTTAGSSSNFLNKLSALLVLWVGAYLVLQGELSLGQLIAFRIISGYVTAPLLRLAQIWQNFQETALSLERLSDILDHPQEADEDNRYQIPMPELAGNVRYENVSFRFASSGPLQLANVNLEFAAGQFVGIVGLSGSGKSTLMKLLPRLYNPDSGRILIDNYDISKVELYSLRRQVGIVPQDSLLFEGTIQENIALTNPDAETEAIITAAQIACAHDFIMNLPLGYNTRVGERGSSLSGGQRQRIAIARTILQNPRLLILDEATSALDYDTERQVSHNLMEWAEGRTVFFITHRLNTIQSADQILVMDQGAAVEQGTHAELMALQGRYYCLYQQQTNLV
ncbi:peptidase domain-containing ABC transporter [Almyronema epifaneia]|uniref:Peptidase domain-containing ABC transporter n=1 Tax=Almyronema epifaneia S1 TaxID=2991925 RepID=A0ABW6IAN3_9CYAN